MNLKKFLKKQSSLSAFLLFVYILITVKNSQKIVTIMKNLSLFVTLGIISFMGTFTTVNAGEMDSQMDSQNSGTVQLNDESSNTQVEGLEPGQYPTDEAGNPILPSDDESVEMPAESATDPGATDPVDTAPAAE